MVRMEDGRVQGLASRELVQPFSLEALKVTREFSNKQTEILRELCQQVGGEVKNIGVALNHTMVLVKKVPVALGMAEASVKEHLAWEAEQFLIDSLEDYILEIEILPIQTPEGNPLHLIVVVRKSVLRGIRQLVQRAGLNLQNIDVDVFASIRALKANYEFDEKTVVLTDFGRDSITFYIIHEGEYYLSHRVFLKEGIGCSEEPYDCEDITKLMAKELRRVIFGHRLGSTIDDIGHIFLTGGELIQDVEKVLSTKTSAPINIVNPFQRVPVSEAVKRSPGFNTFPDRYLASVGVTLQNK